jgi:hypothetical protein
MARVDVGHLGAMRNNRAAYFSGAPGKWVDSKDEFLFTNLLDNADDWTIDVDRDSNALVLSHTFQPSRGPTVVGRRRVVCDITKDLVPLRVDLEWRLNDSFWREERTVLSEPIEVKGLWMPTRIEERIRASSLGADNCSMYITKVKKITVGDVKEGDLDVVFPAGTAVTDVLSGISFTAGGGGARNGVRRLATQREKFRGSGPLSSGDRTRGIRYAIVGANAGVLLLCAIFVRMRMRRKQVQPSSSVKH